MSWLACATNCAITDHWVTLRQEVVSETRYYYGNGVSGLLGWWYKTRKTTITDYVHTGLTLAAAEAMADANTTHPGARSWTTSGTFNEARAERGDGEMYRCLKTSTYKPNWAGSGGPPLSAGNLDGWTAANLDA